MQPPAHRRVLHTARRFRAYQTDPAVLDLKGPATATQNQPTRIRFFVNKRSAVQVVVTRDGDVGLDRTATFRRGDGSFEWTPQATGTLHDPAVGEGAAHRQGPALAAPRARCSSVRDSLGRPLAPRTILYTGKGGVGKTSVAAATARRCAAAGLKTVVLSTDPAHSLSDSLEEQLGGEPTEIAPNLWGQEVQAQEQMETHWDAVGDWLGELLAERGVDRISADELTVPPGMDELFSLLQIKRHHEEAVFDCVIVDCAPTGETLRLLSFPDVAKWWLEKVFPWERRIMSAARPLARGLLDVPLPDEAVFDDVERLVRNLVAMNAILRDRSTTSVRLVMNPDRMVVKESMRTFTYLNLYGYLTDAVVVNRVLPEEAGGGYFDSWRDAQAEHMELVRSAFSPVPILTAPWLPREVVGQDSLDELGRDPVRLRGRRGRAARGALTGAVQRQRQRHAAPAAALRRAGRHRPQEDRARGDRAGRRPEADYHPAARDGGLRHHRAPASRRGPSKCSSRRKTMDRTENEAASTRAVVGPAPGQRRARGTAGADEPTGEQEPPAAG